MKDLLNDCKQNTASLSLLIGTTVGKHFQRKIVNIFKILTFVLGAQKDRLIEMLISSTHKKCFN